MKTEEMKFVSRLNVSAIDHFEKLFVTVPAFDTVLVVILVTED